MFTTPARRRATIAAAVAAPALLLAACGGNDDEHDGMDHGGKPSAASAPASPPASPAPGQNPAPGAFNDADVMFAQMMIPHHEQALEMAALADGRAQDAEIKALATEIAGAQDPEIRKMRSWLAAWGRPEDPAMAGMDHGSGSSHGSMDGMMTPKELGELKAAKGTAFDQRFAELMIAHHKGAVDMAREQTAKGRNATATRLAQDVVRTQSTEIDAFTAILGRL
ncbi:DUF305 domain-containing protein [Streptomyces sp. NPDC057638]|uniref:DUF305 domain-containing protein n=1 Tax=Streptomyces sp. NPDC057638 TaxID=3346190 RepID=UPI0036C0CAB0